MQETTLDRFIVPVPTSRDALPPLGEGPPRMHRYALDRERRPSHAASARDPPQRLLG